VGKAREHGWNCAGIFHSVSPDLSMITQHLGLFSWRPDGSIRHAENPPKKYEEIVKCGFFLC